MDKCVYDNVDSTYTQADWWAANGLKFNFIGLPAELRTNIYRQVIGPYVWPRFPIWSSGPQEWQHELCLFDVDSPDHYLSALYHPKFSDQYHFDPNGARIPSPTALPIVNRQIQNEYLKVLFENTYKHFKRTWDFVEMIPYMQTIHFNCLRRISLGLMNSEFFDLIGVYADRDLRSLFQSGHTPAIEMLGHIETLECLNFHFQMSPQVEYDVPDADFEIPWRTFADPWAHKWSTRPPHVSCQKIIVDWILTLAFDYIRQIREVTLSGHVKLSTRAKWETIFADEQKGIRHDMTDSINEIAMTPFSQL